MLHIADIRQNKNSIINKLLIKNFNAENLITSISRPSGNVGEIVFE